MMLRFFFILLGYIALGSPLMTQQVYRVMKDGKPYLDPSDGSPVYAMETVVIQDVYPNKKIKQQTEKKIYKFNALRYDVLKVLPYANEAAKNLKEIHSDLEKIPGKQEKEAYLDSKKGTLFGKYEKELKELYVDQGYILVKLVDRQSGQSTYSIIKELTSGFNAFLWQSAGRIFGYNLKDEFDAGGEDLAIELIVQSFERGENISYYDYISMVNEMKQDCQ